MKTRNKWKELWSLLILSFVIIIIGFVVKPNKERPMRDYLVEQLKKRGVEPKRFSVLYNDKYIVCQEKNDMWPHWVDNYYILGRENSIMCDSLIVFDKQKSFVLFCDSLKVPLKYEL